MAKKPAAKFFGDSMSTGKKAPPLMDVGVIIAVKPVNKPKQRKENLLAPAKVVGPKIKKPKRGIL